jgi:hypothetical protein
MRRRFLTVMLVLPLLAVTLPARADWGISGDVAQDMANEAMRDVLMRDVLADMGTQRRAPASRGPTASRGSSTIVALGDTRSVVQALAARYPVAKRAEAERLFATLLRNYAGIEQRFGIPAGDVSGAVAAFIAGQYMGYHNRDFPDAHFAPLVAQMRSKVRDNPGFAGASASDQRGLYARLAILGMFMASTQMALKQKPDAAIEARMRAAASRNLQQFLGVAPERVIIGSAGLVIR